MSIFSRNSFKDIQPTSDTHQTNKKPIDTFFYQKKKLTHEKKLQTLEKNQRIINQNRVNVKWNLKAIQSFTYNIYIEQKYLYFYYCHY